MNNTAKVFTVQNYIQAPLNLIGPSDLCWYYSVLLIADFLDHAINKLKVLSTIISSKYCLSHN